MKKQQQTIVHLQRAWNLYCHHIKQLNNNIHGEEIGALQEIRISAQFSKWYGCDLAKDGMILCMTLLMWKTVHSCVNERWIFRFNLSKFVAIFPNEMRLRGHKENSFNAKVWLEQNRQSNKVQEFQFSFECSVQICSNMIGKARNVEKFHPFIWESIALPSSVSVGVGNSDFLWCDTGPKLWNSSDKRQRELSTRPKFINFNKPICDHKSSLIYSLALRSGGLNTLIFTLISKRIWDHNNLINMSPNRTLLQILNKMLLTPSNETVQMET